MRTSPACSASLSVVLSLIAAACGGPPPEADIQLASAASDESGWLEYRAAATPFEGRLIAEGDLIFQNEDRLKEYYLNQQEETEGALTAHVLANGQLGIWDVATQHHIRYCLDDSFGSRRQETENALHAATGAWEDRVDVDFYHDKSQDGAGCNAANPNVEFRVRGVTNVLAVAAAFFPNDPQFPKEITINLDSAYTLRPPISLEGVLRHEVGHALGFRHEFARSGNCREPSLQNLTSYDLWSVMGYAEGACPDRNTGFFMSPRDFQGAISIYGEARRVDRMVGDFNGDGRSDVAMWRAGWHSIPVYLAQPDGSFITTNYVSPNNRINSDPSAVKLLGDFDGDRKTDILVAAFNSGATTVYYSMGDGSFTARDVIQPDVPLGAAGASRFVGRFNNDSRDDVLVIRPDSPVATVWLSAARGVPSNVVTQVLPTGQRWLNLTTANRMLGDFDGDGLTDVALWQEGWASTPVYFSDGTGRFVITNAGHAAAENWINDPAATKVVGVFGSARRAGILLTRPDWSTAPVYDSESVPGARTGRFLKTNRLAPGINRQDVVRIPGDFDGDGLTDIMMVDPFGVVGPRPNGGSSSSGGSGTSSSESGTDGRPQPGPLGILFSNLDGTFTSNSGVQVRDRTMTTLDFNHLTQENSSLLVGRFDQGLTTDVMVWSSGLTTNPIIYGTSRIMVTASNRRDPFWNLLNAR